MMQQVYFNETKQCDINITSGIQQGCNGSSELCITYLIRKKCTIVLIEYKVVFARW